MDPSVSSLHGVTFSGEDLRNSTTTPILDSLHTRRGRGAPVNRVFRRRPGFRRGVTSSRLDSKDPKRSDLVGLSYSLIQGPRRG